MTTGHEHDLVLRHAGDLHDPHALVKDNAQCARYFNFPISLKR